jgi:hypothetical protein
MPTKACIPVQDVDVLLFRPDRPIDYQLVRKELVSRFSGLFKERAEPLFFKYKPTDELKNKQKAKCSYLVQVDIIPEYLVHLRALVRWSSQTNVIDDSHRTCLHRQWRWKT